MADEEQKSRKRAIRRHHRARLKKYRARHYGGPSDRQGRELARWYGGVVTTATRCSCWMCGNPRRYHNELTIQERRMLAGLRGEDGVCENPET